MTDESPHTQIERLAYELGLATARLEMSQTDNETLNLELARLQLRVQELEATSRVDVVSFRTPTQEELDNAD